MVSTMGLFFVVSLGAPPADFDRMLRSGDSLARARAVYIATRMADPSKQRSKVRDAMRMEPGPVRAATIRGIGFRNYDAAPPNWVVDVLIDALGDHDEEVREAAALSIAILRIEKAVPALGKALEAEKSTASGDRVRRALLEAAGRLQDPSLGKHVVNLYKSGSGGSIQEFPLLTRPSTSFLASAADLGLPVAREYVARNYRLVTIGPDGTVVSKISTTLTSEGKATLVIAGDPVLRLWTARAAAVSLGDSTASLDYLEQTLFAQIPQHRLETAWALASMPETKGRKQALRMLARASEDQFGAVRAVVIRTFAAEGTNANVLVGALDDPFPDLRAEAALGLAEAGLIDNYRELIGTLLESEEDPLVIAAWQAALRRK